MIMKQITIVSPAKCIEQSKVQSAKKQLELAGFNVHIASHVTNKHHYFSGTDSERLMDVQCAMDDPETDFILCARGGYGTVRLINHINYTRYIKDPKPIIGFSDITVFHNKMQQLGIASIHASMPISFDTHSTHAMMSFINVLKGHKNTYSFPKHAYNRIGSAAAPVTGGNLAVISSLMGTPLEINTDNTLLFIEDIGEAIYSVERILWQLKIAGKLANLKGLMIGGMTNIKDTVIPYHHTVESIIAEMVSEYSYPICFNFPAGHINDNRAIILGKEATLTISNTHTTFIQ